MPRRMTAWRPAIALLFASQWRGFAIGFFAAASLAWLGRRLFRPLAIIAAAAGLMAGTLAAFSEAGQNRARLAIAVIAAAAMVLGGFAAPPARKKRGARPAPRPFLPPTALLGLALLAGAWWLGGAGRSLGAVIAAWRPESLIMFAAAAMGWPLLAGIRAAPRPAHWLLAALAAALAAAFVAIGRSSAAPFALTLAGVALGAGIGGDQNREHEAEATAIGVAAGLALLVAAALLADGRTLRLRPSPVWATPLAPLMTLWLFRRLAPRFAGPLARRLGGGALASLLTLALVTLLAFSAAAIAGLR